jgi:hypothetical protein
MRRKSSAGSNNNREAEAHHDKRPRDCGTAIPLEILQQLNAEGEGLAEGSQAVLRGLDDPARILPALTGALASPSKSRKNSFPQSRPPSGETCTPLSCKMVSSRPKSSPLFPLGSLDKPRSSYLN